jgi:acyl carrier protein
MNINEFIINFSSQFEDTDISNFSADTKYKGLEEWSSLTVLLIIGMVDEIYGIRVKEEDFQNTVTIEDLFNLVLLRKKENE